MLRKISKRAQTTAEYAILIALVVGAVVAMQIFVRRGLQGRIYDVVNDVDLGGKLTSSSGGAANPSDVLSSSQYEPYYTTSTAGTTQTATDTESLKEGGAVSRGSTASTTVGRTQETGWQNYPNE